MCAQQIPHAAMKGRTTMVIKYVSRKTPQRHERDNRRWMGKFFFLFVFWEKTILHISKSIFLCVRMNGARWQQKAPQKRAGLASPSIGQERSFFIQKKFVNVTWWQLVAHVVAISVVLCGRMCTRNSIGPIFIHLTTSALLMPLYTEVMTMYYTDLKLAKVPSVSNRLTCVTSPTIGNRVLWVGCWYYMQRHLRKAQKLRFYLVMSQFSSAANRQMKQNRIPSPWCSFFTGQHSLLTATEFVCVEAAAVIFNEGLRWRLI